MIVGTSLTWIWTTTLVDGDFNIYSEYTWNTNIAVSLSKRVYIGIQLLNIYAQDKNKSFERFTIYGLFAQYNILRNTDHRFFIETSISRGNFCTCGDFLPRKKENLYYWGLGIGYDLPLNIVLNGLYADFSFLNYLILSPVYDKYNYTQYVIGLNYRFGK
jgi:hypothetical protein